MSSPRGWLDGRLATGANAILDFLVVVAASAFAIWTTNRTFAGESFVLGWFSMTAAAVWFITGLALRHYDPTSYNRARSDDASLVAVLVLASATVLRVVTLVLLWRNIATPPVVPFLLSALPAALAVRFLFRVLARREGPVDEVLIVGIGPIGRITGQDLAKRREHRVIGHLRFADESDRDAALLRRSGADGQIYLLGFSSDLETILRTTPVSEVYIAGNARRHDAEMQVCIKICERLGVPFALPAYGFRLERARPMDSHAIGDGYIHYLSVGSKPHQMVMKRLFDIVSSAFALWVLSPGLLTVALLIKLTSRGPVLFKQVRVGLHGRTFHMLKFRSMVQDAEALKARLSTMNEQDGPVFKMKRDPRITAVGRIIRKYSIDELPQLINVLRGDMSVVGPRPPVPAEVAKYEAWQLRRLSVRPGLTCIWQVSGRNQISFEQWMYLDLVYIDHWSLSQDFSLIFKTVPAVITGRGAS
jgi:exopolysaccharide biosynthesis polyprenyl glycosylphosphotransferase